jgi:hypothetical protein
MPFQNSSSPVKLSKRMVTDQGQKLWRRIDFFCHEFHEFSRIILFLRRKMDEIILKFNRWQINNS